MTKLTLEQQELIFTNDCKLINLRYEYHGYTGSEKWAIVTELAEEELWVKYGDAVTVARDEFNRTFSEFKNLQITETSTMARTTSTERVVIQFRYSSDNGDGLYGFEIEKTATGSYDIIQQGEDVIIDNLVKEQ